MVAQNLSMGVSCVCLMAEQAKASVFPVDMGVAGELHGYGEFQDGVTGMVSTEGGGPVKNYIWNRKLSRGTRNFLKEPAMSREQAIDALEAGIELAGHLKEQGYELLATGEMGIGNTTTSSAVAAVLLGADPEIVTGKGAGLTSDGLKRKQQVIRQGIQLWQPDPQDGIAVLSTLGGYDLAGMAGLFIGGARYRLPVVIDGVISATAALAASVICPTVKDFMLASHCSAEPASGMLLQKLGKEPVIQAQLCLGEGTGAVALFPLLDMAAKVYDSMSTFEQIQVEQYRPLT